MVITMVSEWFVHGRWLLSRNCGRVVTRKKGVGSMKSPAIGDVGSERGWIVMTFSESHITKLLLDLVVYNHLGSLPLIIGF